MNLRKRKFGGGAFGMLLACAGLCAAVCTRWDKPEGEGTGEGGGGAAGAAAAGAAAAGAAGSANAPTIALPNIEQLLANAGAAMNANAGAGANGTGTNGTGAAAGGAAPKVEAPTMQLVQGAVTLSIEAERKRVAAITSRASYPVFKGNQAVQDLAAKAVSEGWTPESFGDHAAALIGPKPTGHVAEAGSRDATLSITRDQRDTFRQTAGLSFAVSANPDVVRAIENGGPRGDAMARAWGFENASKAWGAISGLRANGRGVMSVKRVAMLCVASALSIAADQAHAMYDEDPANFMRILNSGGGMGTSDFPNILSNLQGKSLAAGWNMAPTVWQEFCGIGTATDFKNATLLDLGEGGKFRARSEHQNTPREQGLAEAARTIAVQGYDTTVSYTYEMLRNDDLGAFSTIVQRVGAKARLIPEDLFILALTANTKQGMAIGGGVNLFATGNSNLGTAAALAYAAVIAEMKAMMKIKDNAKLAEDQDYVDVMPTRILVPTDLFDVAENLFVQEFTDGTPGQQNQRSILRGRFKPISTPRLSGTDWYLSVEPGANSALEMRFLDGNQLPVVNQITNGDPWQINYKLSVMGVGIGARPRVYGLRRNPGA